MSAVVFLGAGLVFGALLLVTVGVQERRVFGGAEPPLTGDERVAVVRAVSAGTPPGDRRLRAAADRLADRRARPPARPLVQGAVFGVFLLLALVLALTRTPWFWLGVLFWVVVICVALPAERRSRHAAERYLRAAPPSAASAPRSG
jgi:Flp pilus assembly protein TadB